MKYFYLLIITLFLSACQNPSSKNYQTPNYEKIADQITAKTVQKIEAETGLQLIGIGGGAIDCIRKLNISFQCLGEITIEQARELLIYCINEYLSQINTNEEIRPYLIHYPFTPKDLQVEIFIRKHDRTETPIGALSVAGVVNGILDYEIKQPDPIVLKKIHEETYEEAVKILETQMPLNKVRSTGWIKRDASV